MKKKILSIALGLILIALTSNTYAADKSHLNGAKLTPTVTEFLNLFTYWKHIPLLTKFAFCNFFDMIHPNFE